MSIKNISHLLFFVLLISLLVSCIPGFLFNPTSTPMPPTATPTPLPRTLTICLGQEPDNLYAFGTSSPAAWSVLAAIYDGPIDIRKYQLSPVIMEKIPSVENGDVFLQSIEVKDGDEVLDADSNLVSLKTGVAVFPHGCTSSECVLAWDGVTPLQLDQMTVTFRLKPGLKWSDGQALTAVDSVFSFQIASDQATPLTKDLIDQTFSYTAIDDRSVQWMGKPGLITFSIDRYFWLPLPQHVLGKLKPLDLLTAEESSKRPMGWGPYIIQDWQKEKSIRLAKNPNYFRAGEGLPKFDFLEYHFLNADENPIEAVKNGKCDFIDSSAFAFENISRILDSQKAKQLQVYIIPGTELELIAFGIKPASYDDNYNPFGVDRLDFFGDVRVRQAIAYCIDRQTIIKDLLFGITNVPASYMPPSDPLLTTEFTAIPFDPAKGNELLTAAGWLDYDKNPATPRVAVGAKNIPMGMPLTFNYITTNAGLRKQIAERIVSSLAQCGIQVKPTTYTIEEIYKPAPDGIVFGRKFDLAEFAWQVEGRTGCANLSSTEIPTLSNFWLGKTSGGANFMGYNNLLFDEDCRVAQRAGLNVQQYSAKQQELAQIINQDLPVIPLFFHPQIFIARNELCGFEADASSRTALMQLEDFDYGSGCQK